MLRTNLIIGLTIWLALFGVGKCKPKAGNCPKPLGVGICLQQCNNDEECAGVQKCVINFNIFTK